MLSLFFVDYQCYLLFSQIELGRNKIGKHWFVWRFDDHTVKRLMNQGITQ